MDKANPLQPDQADPKERSEDDEEEWEPVKASKWIRGSRRKDQNNRCNIHQRRSESSSRKIDMRGAYEGTAKKKCPCQKEGCNEEGYEYEKGEPVMTGEGGRLSSPATRSAPQDRRLRCQAMMGTIRKGDDEDIAGNGMYPIACA